jgi:hypothetical protein
MLVNLDTGEELRVSKFRLKKNFIKDEKGQGYVLDLNKGVLKSIK